MTSSSSHPLELSSASSTSAWSWMSATFCRLRNGEFVAPPSFCRRGVW